MEKTRKMAKKTVFVGVVMVVVVTRVVAKVVTNHGRVAIILNERKANWPIKTSNGCNNGNTSNQKQPSRSVPRQTRGPKGATPNQNERELESLKERMKLCDDVMEQQKEKDENEKC